MDVWYQPTSGMCPAQGLTALCWGDTMAPNTQTAATNCITSVGHFGRVGTGICYLNITLWMDSCAAESLTKHIKYEFSLLWWSLGFLEMVKPTYTWTSWHTARVPASHPGDCNGMKSWPLGPTADVPSVPSPPPPALPGPCQSQWSFLGVKDYFLFFSSIFSLLCSYVCWMP